MFVVVTLARSLTRESHYEQSIKIHRKTVVKSNNRIMGAAEPSFFGDLLCQVKLMKRIPWTDGKIMVAKKSDIFC